MRLHQKLHHKPRHPSVSPGGKPSSRTCLYIRWMYKWGLRDPHWTRETARLRGIQSWAVSSLGRVSESYCIIICIKTASPRPLAGCRVKFTQLDKNPARRRGV